MRILVTEDDRTTRFLVKRVLERDLGFEVDEADNGAKALELVLAQKYDLLVLDLQMPQMDGTEVLERLRAADFASLPVIILTATKDEAAVQRLLQLGVRDYLLKPLNRERLTAAIDRVLGAKKRHADRTNGRPTAAGAGLPRYPGVPVMVVDADAAFRQFLADTFQGCYPVLTANSGLQALKLCMEAGRAPRAIYLGDGLGALGADLLSHKLRVLPRLVGASLIRVLPDGASPPAGQDIEFISRTADAGQYREQIERLLRPANALKRLLSIYPVAKSKLGAAAEQFFTVTIGMQVERLLGKAPGRLPETLGAAVMVVLREEQIVLELRLQTDARSAQTAGARLFGVGPDAVSPDQARQTAFEALNFIAGGLVHHLVERGIAARHTLPVAAAPVEPADGSKPDERIDVTFESPEREMRFRVILEERPAAPVSATPEASTDPAASADAASSSDPGAAPIAA